MSFENNYTLRRVAEANHKLCDICSARFTTCVLITADQKDFFYVCSAHLKDAKFCKPKTDPEAAAAARREKALQEEVERVKKEYEEKQKKKKKDKDKDKDEKKDGKDSKDEKKDEKKDGDKEDAKTGDDKKNDEKTESKANPPSPSSSADEAPRTFELTPAFYQLRIDTKKRQELAKQQMEMARLNQQRLQDPNFFPSVPKSKP